MTGPIGSLGGRPSGVPEELAARSPQMPSRSRRASGIVNTATPGFRKILPQFETADRPSPGIMGRAIWDVDEEVLYIDNGTAWIPINGTGAVSFECYTVVLEPIMAGLFTHETFGHLSEADFSAENPAAREMMTLGRQFGPCNLNIYDDGALPRLRRSLVYDDEGVPAQKTWVMCEGVLVGRLHNRETAGQMNERPTGNARATSYRYAPQVRMTNTAIAPSDGGSLHDMIKDIEACMPAIGRAARRCWKISRSWPSTAT